jgi:eukaryotic-like serine/threonine-protein kinase
MDGQSLRWFVYVSDAKLADLLHQIDDRTRRSILETLGPSVSVSAPAVSVTLTPKSRDRSVRNRAWATQVAVVEEHIRRQRGIGDLARGEHWIAGRADLSWAVLTGGDEVLFCGYAGPQLIALRGSARHLAGAPSSGARSGSYQYLDQAVAPPGGALESLGPELAAAAHAMLAAPQPVRFLAQVIRRGPLEEDGPQREFVYATPLYVEDAHDPDESRDISVPGQVTWFSADRGWGLIAPDGQPDAVVVTPAAPVTGDISVLAVGQRVEFRIAHGPAGIEAAAVRVLPALADSAALAASRGRPLDPADPPRIADYELLGRLGVGSMGVVYLARDDGGDLVAVKVIKPEYAGDRAFLRRFQGEAELARRVSAPNVARVIAVLSDSERPCLVTEFVDGLTLEQSVAEHGPLRERAAVDFAAGTAAALEATHAAGIVHRDLAPSNVILSDDGPKLIDFGLARAIGSDTSHTQLGQPPGTPAYMSPEQIVREELTAASDIFSWAGLTVFAATGDPPFAAADAPQSVVWRQISEGKPNLGGLPGSLRDVVKAALNKDPALRPNARQILRCPPFAAAPQLPGREGGLGRNRPVVAATAVAAVVLAVIGVIVAQLLSSSSSSSSTAPSSTSTSGPSTSARSSSSGATTPAGSSGAGSAAASPAVSTAAVSAGQLDFFRDPNGQQPQELAYSADGSMFAGSVGGNSNDAARVDLWNGQTGKFLKPIQVASGTSAFTSLSLAYDPVDAAGLAVADGPALSVWNTRTYRQEVGYTDPDDAVITAVAYSPDGTFIAEASVAGTVRLLDVTTGRWQSQTFQGTNVGDTADSGTDYPVQLVFSPMGHNLALVQADGDVYVWNLSSGASKHLPDTIHNACGSTSCQEIAFSPDGGTLAMIEPASVQLWDTKTWTSAPLPGSQESPQNQESEQSPEAVAYTPGGATLLVGYGGGQLAFDNLSTGHSATLQTQQSGWISLAFGSGGKILAASAINQPLAYLYSVKYAS